MSTHFVGLSLPAPCLSKPSHINLEYNKDEERCNSPASPTSPLTPPIASNRLFPLSPAHLKTSTSAVTKAHNAMDGQEVFIDDGTLTPTYDLSYYFHLGSSSEDLQSNLHRERAASIGSILSSKPTIIPVQTSNDKALKYKQKTDKSNQKAYQFFGEQVKLEISAKEIKKEGLKALLYSTVPLGYFLYHLLQEYSSENLFFFLAVDKYENHRFANEDDQLEASHNISTTYLNRDADLEVNLEDRTYRNVTQALELQEKSGVSTGREFEAAKKQIFTILSVSYHRFRNSSIWDIMESKCGKLNQSNRERAQGLVTNLLLSHIQKKPSFRPRSNSNNRLPRDTVADMVRAFCKNYLPHGYESWKLREKQWEGTPLSVNRSVSTNFSSGRPRSKSMVNEKKSISSFGSKFDLFGKKLSRK